MGQRKNRVDRDRQLVRQEQAGHEVEVTENRLHGRVSGQIVAVSQNFSGPIPPPALLREYDTLLPGAAERIIKMAEGQSAHRQSMESHVIKSDTRRAWAGVICGLLIALSAIGMGGACILYGHDVAGGTLGTVGLGSIIYTFVIGTNSRRSEREGRFKGASKK